ncbi:hypothetical protein AKJ63_00115 [candidate division MSBL1 archaeon SCGC-AAA259D18]|uniref:Uncharacterized protein n=1 Tax=candidate division MSBL1 archaeon SCGC-AAA259D18 TaxID=1698262 RepID=A0A133UCS6_9EURY|nr:hypothetical protein AKJ63_00115 [candidate division MSBL1 archaeon SCGC-AAA259D18]
MVREAREKADGAIFQIDSPGGAPCPTRGVVKAVKELEGAIKGNILGEAELTRIYALICFWVCFLVEGSGLPLSS